MGGKEFGAITSEDGELNELFSKEVRGKKIKWWLAWGALNVLLGAYMIILLFFYWDSWNIPCVKKLNVWLLVYLVINGLHLIRTGFIIYIWKKSPDPSLQ